MRPRQTRRRGLELGCYLPQSKAIDEPAEDAKRPRVAGSADDPGHQRQWLPHGSVVRKPEPIRHDANDGGRRRVDPNRAADHGGIAVVPGSPHRTAEDDDARCTRPIVVGPKVPAEDRLVANQAKRLGRDVDARNTLGRALVVSYREGTTRISGDSNQALDGAPKIPNIGVRQTAVAISGVEHGHVHNAVGMKDRQATKTIGVDDGKERVVHAEPQCKRCDGDERKRAIPE